MPKLPATPKRFPLPRIRVDTYDSLHRAASRERSPRPAPKTSAAGADTRPPAGSENDQQNQE